jgi:4-amino-4-deoxy-L-arabinose transferase-like glycosyltransferase
MDNAINDYPFWAKPPLSTWLSALSYIMANEFAARLLSFTQYALIIVTGKW